MYAQHKCLTSLQEYHISKLFLGKLDNPFTHQEINVHPSGMISRDLRRHAAPAVISIKSENKMIAYSEALLGII